MNTYSSASELSGYLIKNPKKYLIFDLDGTLVTLRLDWSICVKEMYRRLQKVDKSYMQQFTPDDISYEMYNILIKKYGKKVKDLIREYYQYFEIKYLKGVDYNENLFGFIKNNQNKYKYYIWSSNRQITVNKALEKNNYQTLFKKIVSGDTIAFFKPDPEGFSNFLFDKDTQKKSDWMMIGDSINDEKAAKNAGIDYFKLIYCTLE